MPEHTPSADTIDPVTLEILRSNLVAITEEMKTNLRRTAYNQIIYEAQDFTVGLFDINGDTVSIGLGLPMFVGGLARSIKAKIAHYGLEGMEPGDIILTNDPYIMGSHLNHMIFTVPVFADGRIVAFASSMAHWLDIGGVLNSTTRDIYSEGLQVPIVKVFKRGVQDEELTRLIAANVRFPELAMGDFRAQVAAIRTGERRLGELIERYGTATVTEGFDVLHDRAEKIARTAVAKIPDGVYEAETAMDDDGINDGEPVPIRVRVIVAGDEMTIDLSDVSPQVAGYFNSGDTAGHSAAQVAFKFLTTPHEYPVNEGSLRPVKVRLPAGLVVSAQKPAAMRMWMTYPMTIVDCVFRAVAEAVPESAIAGHHADLGVALMHGYTESGRLFFSNYGPGGGGWGATATKDGENATICINDGDTHNTPVEVSEAKMPLTLVESYALRTDSGGPGANRGGLGTVYELAIDADIQLSSHIERTQNAPWGVAGGSSGAPNRISVVDVDGVRGDLPPGKIDSVDVPRGRRVRIEMGGGGGYGDPFTRAAGRVLADVRSGYVSPDAAAEHYGVIVTSGADGTVSIDQAATDARRSAKR